MKPNQIDEGRLSDKGHGLGTVTQQMVMQRASEIAVINGRPANQIIQSDVAQARRELAGHTGLELDSSPAEQLAEDRRWDPLPQSDGKEAPAISPSDEQTFAQKLVEQGVDDAEHDQMINAERESLKRETEECDRWPGENSRKEN